MEEVAYKSNEKYDPKNYRDPSAGTFKDYNLYNFINLHLSRQISKWALDTGANPTLYTVPAGKIFILQSAFINAVSNALAPVAADQVLYCSDGDMPRILTMGTPTTAAGAGSITNSIALSFPFGLIFKAGTRFYLDNGGGDYNLWGGISGFELPEKQI